MDDWNTGIVVKHEEDAAIVFGIDQTIYRFLKDGRNVRMNVGEWLDWNEETGELINRPPKLNTSIIDNSLHIPIIAACPNCSLINDKFREKWDNLAWSPFLGLIRDPKNLFEILPGNEMFNVVVKYSPNDTTNWELMEIGKKSDNPEYQLAIGDAPWSLQQIEFEIEKVVTKNSSDNILRRGEDLQDDQLFCGICVKTTQSSAEIWCQSIGLLSVIRRDKHRVKKGKWYSFIVQFNRREQFNAEASAQRVAKKLIEINPRVRTHVFHFITVGVETSFNLTNIIITKGFFYDYNVGKVEINNDFHATIEALTGVRRGHYHEVHLKISGIAIFNEEDVEKEGVWSIFEITKIVDGNGVTLYFNP